MTSLARSCVWRAYLAQSPHAGGAVLAELPIIDGDIDAPLSAVGTAQVTVDNCADLVAAKVTPRLHELQLVRGDDEHPSFSGPVRFAASTSPTTTLVASDRSWWVMGLRRLGPAEGDASTVLLELHRQAETQQRSGTVASGTLSGWIHEAAGLTVGVDYETSQARWACRHDQLQIGALSFATATQLNGADWEDEPLVLIDGDAWASDIVGADDTPLDVMVNPGVWGRSTATITGGTVAAWRQKISAKWDNPGSTDGTGPRIILSSGVTATGDTTGGGTLRKGVAIDWAALRPGAIMPVAVDAGPLSLGTPNSPAMVEVTRVGVTLGRNGAETGLAVDARSV